MKDVRVQDCTVNGKCSNCGNCCSGVLPLSDAEVKRIARYIEQNHIKEHCHHGRVGIDLTCPFRDEINKKCLVYAVRPEICRRFMCNHDLEEIRKAKRYFHDINRVVYMRHEFYGNSEAVEYIQALNQLVMRKMGGRM